MEHTGISPKVLTQIAQLAERNNLFRVVLFGSRARGDFHRASDIDLAVSGGNLLRFSLDIEEETDTLLTFDVVNLDTELPPALRHAIETEGILLYEKI